MKAWFREKLRKFIPIFKTLLATALVAFVHLSGFNEIILGFFIKKVEFDQLILLGLAEFTMLLICLQIGKWAVRFARERQSTFYFGTTYGKKQADKVDAHWRRKRFRSRKAYVEHLIGRDLRA